MSRPLLLDLFCGQGGAAKGYIDSGFNVIGVDIADHSARYPADTFWQESALDVLEDLVRQGMAVVSQPSGKREAIALRDIAAIHASPPCQGYSIATAGNPTARAKHKRMIAATRELLTLTGKPWVIENVEQAKSQMDDPILLCGRMFGLTAPDADGIQLHLDRHRLFESNVDLYAPEHGRHLDVQVAGVYGGSRRAHRNCPRNKKGRIQCKALPCEHETYETLAPRDRYAARVERGGGYVPRSIPVQQELLGIDWMTVKGMQESIPPVYAQHVGMQLLEHLRAEVAA